MKVRDSRLKPISDEELAILHLQYEFILELERILSSREDINLATQAHKSLRNNNVVTDLQTLEALRIFNIDGELKQEASGVTIDSRFLHPAADESDLPLRERIIIDAAKMEASVRIRIKYSSVITAKTHEAAYYPKPKVAGSRANHAGVDEFISSAMQMDRVAYSKLSPLRLVTPDSYYLSEDSKKKMNAVKSEYHLKFLLQRLATLDEDYKKLGRTKHTATINTLLRAANTIAESNASNQDKIADIVNLIQIEFNKQLTNYTSGFNFFRGNKRPEDFVNLLNKNTNDYQFPRLLAVILQNTYRDDKNIGDLGLKHLLNDFDNTKSQHRPIYRAKIPDVTNDYVYPFFVTNLKNVGLNQTEIDKLYTTPVTVDKELLKKLWPELLDYAFTDAQLESLIHSPPGPLSGQIREICSQLDENLLNKRRDAASMNATLDEVMGQSNKVTPEQRKHLHAKIAQRFTPEGVELRIKEIRLAIEFMQQRKNVFDSPRQQIRPHI